MTTDEYKRRVITLFKPGTATEAAWQELGEALLLVSESECSYEVEEIDKLVGWRWTETQEAREDG